MTKQEFLKEVNRLLPEDKKINEVTENEYSVIEKVYAWYPSISNEHGKEEIAYLYVHFGWVLITDMLSRTKRMEGLERDITRITQDHDLEMRRLEKLKQEITQGIV